MAYEFECLGCGKHFHSKDKRRKYCSHGCHIRHEYRIGSRIVPKNLHGVKGMFHGNSTSFKRGDNRTMGAKNINWKGGVSSVNHQVRTSADWKQWRIMVFERDNFTCQKCGERGQFLHPHHIVPVKECIEADRRDLIFDVNNGITWCKDCHLRYHGLLKGEE